MPIGSIDRYDKLERLLHEMYHFIQKNDQTTVRFADNSCIEDRLPDIAGSRSSKGKTGEGWLMQIGTSRAKMTGDCVIGVYSGKQLVFIDSLEKRKE